MAFLRLDRLSVEFPIYQGGSRSLKKSILSASSRGNLGRDARNRFTVKALKDISLEIRHGERIGLIGLNGSGKTTLLKTLAGIYEPSSGTIETEGRLSSLLEVSVGLSPDATGRENILLRGLYMGMRPAEIAGHADRIVEFTELGDYIEAPVRTYSAGMMVRLAFAISTCIQPDILLMDEWLAAGDARFLLKAKARLESFVENSSILVLASHSPELIERWCDRAIFLDRGEVRAAGPLAEVRKVYDAALAADS